MSTTAPVRRRYRPCRGPHHRPSDRRRQGHDRPAPAPRRAVPAGRDARHVAQLVQRHRRPQSALPRGRLRRRDALRHDARAPDVPDGLRLARPHALGPAGRARLLRRQRLGTVPPRAPRRPHHGDRARRRRRGEGEQVLRPPGAAIRRGLLLQPARRAGRPRARHLHAPRAQGGARRRQVQGHRAARIHARGARAHRPDGARRAEEHPRRQRALLGGCAGRRGAADRSCAARCR